MKNLISKIVILTVITMFAALFMTGCESSSEANKLVGEWVQVDNDSVWATITKTDDGYLWEEEGGSYPASFADGKLTFNTSIAEAVAYYDSESNNMIVEFMGHEFRYERKP